MVDTLHWGDRDLTDQILSEMLTQLEEEIEVEKLELYGNNLTLLMDFSEKKQLKNVREINLSWNVISEIKGNIPGNVIHLDISRNNLPLIPNVQHLHHMHTINLGNNHITSIDVDFSQLKSLVTLKLNRNNIKGDLNGEHLPLSIKELDFSDNRISRVMHMHHLTNLRDLNLRRNGLVEVPMLPVNIQEVNISENHISTIPDLSELKCLNSLMLYHNKINDIVIDHLPWNLNILDLSDNKISTVADMSCLKHLKKLYLQTNSISDIAGNCFSRNLLELDISRNKIARIMNIYHLKYLQKLDLHNNKISAIPVGYLPSDVEYLDLSCNKIAKIKNIPRGVKRLYLHSNKIAHVQNLPSSLEDLSLADNPIKEISKECLKTEKSYQVITSEPYIMGIYKYKQLSDDQISGLKSPPAAVFIVGYIAVCQYFQIQPEGSVSNQLIEKTCDSITFKASEESDTMKPFEAPEELDTVKLDEVPEESNSVESAEKPRIKLKPSVEFRHGNMNIVEAYATCALSNIGGLFLLKDIDVDVYAPKDAIESGNVEVSRLVSTDKNAVSFEYRISPHGLTFNQAVLIRFPLMIKELCNLYSLGVKYTNTDIDEADDWCVYPLLSKDSPKDVSFIIWGGYCYLFMNHLCGVSVCQNCETNTRECAYHMNSHLFVRYTPEPRKAALLTTFSCTEKDKDNVQDLKQQWGKPVKEEVFVLYSCGGNVNVEVKYDEEKWKCRNNKSDVDMNRLLPNNDEAKKQPQLEYYLNGKGETDEDTEIEVVFGQREKGSTQLKWNPYWHFATWNLNNNQNGLSTLTEKNQENTVEFPCEKSTTRLPTIEIHNELQPLCEHLQKDGDHLRQVAQDIGAFASKDIQPMYVLIAWFVMKYVQSYKSHELKQQTIWIELVEKLFQCGHFEEQKLLLWIIQKQHLKEKIIDIFKNIQGFQELYSICAKINHIDETIKTVIEKENTIERKMFFLLTEVVLENPLAFDTLVDFLERTNQQDILGNIKLQKIPSGSHLYVLEEVIKRNKSSLIETMTPEICLELKKANFLASKSKKQSLPTANIIVQDLQHTLSSENFGTFLAILCRYGFISIMKKLKEVYLDIGGKEEFCSVPGLQLGTTPQELFTHKSNFTRKYDDFIQTLPEVGKSVCSLHWSKDGNQFHGTGFVVGSLLNVNDQSSPPPRHFLVLTCNHLLSTGLEKAIKTKTGSVRFRFYKENSEAEEVTVKIQCSVLCNDTLDYVLLCLENNEQLTLKLGSKSFLGQYISDTVQQPDHLSVLTLVGYPNTPEKQVDPSVSVYSLEHIQNEGIICVPITQNDDKCVFYKCSSLHGASGSPCFDLHAKMLCSMHQGGTFKIGDNMQQEYQYEHGILLYHVVCNIKQQVLSGNTILNKDGFDILFPAFKSEGPSLMQLSC